MTRTNWIAIFAVLLSATVAARLAPAVDLSRASSKASAGSSIEFFKAMEEKKVDVKFIAKSDHAARLIITNKTKQPLNLQLPEAFAGVPVVAQIGGGGRGGGGGGFGGGGGGGQQSVGGGGGGFGGGGQGGGGGGGGFFSIPAEETAKLNFAVVCLDHGLRDPSSSRPYKIVPATEHLDKPAVVELMKAFGRGELDHQAAQAAAWHLNNDLSWDELAAKLTGTHRSLSRAPYFSRQQIQVAVAYANEARRLAEVNAKEYQRDKQKQLKKANEDASESSESRSTTDDQASTAR